MRPRKSSRIPQYETPTYRAIVERLAARVHALRDARGWTQADAADRCGMTTWQYQRVEGGLTNATLTTLARLAEGFDVDVADLVGPPVRDPGLDRKEG